MDFCTPHFGKSLHELIYNDIVTYFTNEQVENDGLEFKSIHPATPLADRYKGVQKGVSAFLNSGGGLLIWGSPEGKKVDGKKHKVFLGALTPFAEILDKDQIVSKISDSITPLPASIRVKVLEGGSGCIVIIETDPSEYSPHQWDHTYWMRIDGQNKPAPHHYIEALFKKIRYPNIEAFLKVEKAVLVQEQYHISISVWFFNWSRLQNEEKLAFRMTSAGVFAGAGTGRVDGEYSDQGHAFYKDLAKDVFYYGEPIIEREVLLFNTAVVVKHGFKLPFTIGFGGRFSPRKQCSYEIDFNKIYAENIDEMLIIKRENVLSADWQESQGMTNAKVLEMLVKRKIK